MERTATESSSTIAQGRGTHPALQGLPLTHVRPRKKHGGQRELRGFALSGSMTFKQAVQPKGSTVPQAVFGRCEEVLFHVRTVGLCLDATC